MKKQATTFLLGAILGIVLGLVASYSLGQRYELTPAGPDGYILIKTDRWTGRSWQRIPYISTSWEEVER